MLGIGVTATDTEIGKTVVSGALAAAMRYRGYKTGVYKPAASGCVKNSDGKLISTDAEFLLHCAGLNVEKHDQVVPYVLEAALAPAEASRLAGIKIDPCVMLAGAREMLLGSQISIVEGVGGISAPLTDEYLVKDFFGELKLPLVRVVKAVLGNVNHAVLTAEYARIHGLKVVGLIVNGWDRKKAGALEQSNLYYYEKLTGLPILGKLPVLSQHLLDEFNSRELAEITEANIDIDRILSLAGGTVK